MTRGKITYLDGIRLHRALTAGVRQLLSRQGHLNRINVFPIPDGDTGTNLSFTLLFILDNTSRRVQVHAGRTAVAIADAALDGARGCSGVILAQFFQGFSDSCADLHQLNVPQFTQATETGYEYAYQALSEPVDGTILSVIKATVDGFKERTREGVNDFMLLLKETMGRAEEALRRTPEQLEILRKRGVVDAGGQGFVYILRGMLDFVMRGSLRSRWRPEKILPSAELPEPVLARPAAGTDLRYCTECLVLGRDIPRNKLREAIMGLGDSLILGGSKERVRLHIHTNEPQAVFDTVRTYGQLTDEKVDDMQRQTATARTARKGVAVVTDSTADIPVELIEAYDIHVVPLKLHFGNKGYIDKVSITPDEFFQELAINPHHPHTSQPTPGDFWRTYQFLASHYDSIVSLHVSRALSGTLQSAENATRRLPDAHISVLDCNNATVGLGLIAVSAAKVAMEGKSHEEVLSVARAAVNQTVFYAVVKDLSSVVRGGRVPPAYKVIADVLRAVLVLSMTAKGKVKLAGVFFGRRDTTRGLAKWVARHIDLDQTYDVFISHSQSFEEAQRLAGLLPELGLRINQLHITDTGAVIGAHAGSGSLILAVQPVRISRKGIPQGDPFGIGLA
ncbi:MAG: DegV family EDD domain-containing protein [Fidelibacterota bacterium]|nr:MAG: DegV family EDD domain-containing protein [Candidatus Neomarinimicrobiota bacterium]